jgi:voltage-gated sodium channel
MMADYGGLLHALDRLVLAVFVLEIGAEALRLRLGFFRNAWNLFDFIVVGIALVPASGPLAVLRALRVLRVLRLISTVPRLRFVVEALLRAVPGISSIAALMLLLFYVFAVMSTSLFGERFPGVVRQPRRVHVHAVSDHDAGELVHGDRAAGDGRVSAGLGCSSCPSS